MAGFFYVISTLICGFCQYLEAGNYKEIIFLLSLYSQLFDI
jgi:hypothetical protein